MKAGGVGAGALLAVALAAAAAHAQTHFERSVEAPAAAMGAQDAARAAGVDCRVASAVFLGRTEDYRPIYEAVCREGPGYLLVGGRNAQGFNCLALEAQLETERARATGRALPPTCRTPGNRNAVPVVTRFAREAGLDCVVDEAAMIGLSIDNRFIYEAGCRGEVGAWLEHDGAGWIVTDCVIVVAQDGECRFTAADERARMATRWLAARPDLEAARRCVAVDVRYMGGNTAGGWYEAACASGEGLVVRLDAERNMAEVLPCAEAARIGGGCRGGGGSRRQ